MTVTAPDLEAIATELATYLTKLGLEVHRDDSLGLTAARRTSLAEEIFQFAITDSPPRELAESIIYILPDSAPAAKASNLYRLSEFLDRTVQADILCRQILGDESTQQLMEHFVPQRITVNGQPHAESAPQYVNRWLTATQGGLLVVLAPAGYGKTVLSRVLAHRLAEYHLGSAESPADPFPFLIPFGDFRRVASFESMIVQALHRRGVTDVTANAFAHLIERKRCVLILDGFDELLEERPEEARKNLRELLETLHGESRVMVTARSTFFRTSTDVADFLEHGVSADSVTVVDLKPFDATQRRELVQRLSPDQRTITYINDILAVEGMTEAMGSPLLLRETIEALRDQKIRGQLSTKTKRSGLFKVLEASVYERERQRHGHKFPDRVQQRFIERMAEEMLRANVRGFDRESVDVLAYEAAADFAFEAPEVDFAQLSDHHFLTVDYNSDLVRFNHQVFREYFQATALRRAALSSEPWVRLVLHDRPLPEEVARFAAELDGRSSLFAAICRISEPITTRSSYAAVNLATLCESVSDREAFALLMNAVDSSVALAVRLVEADLRAMAVPERMFARLELVDCDLRGADLSKALVRELALDGTVRLTDARFAPGSPEVLQLAHESREFEPAKIQRKLRELGVAGLDVTDADLHEEAATWRRDLEDLIASRLRRFHSGIAGDSYLWDVSISEKNLLGGLDQVKRWTATQLLIPQLVRSGVLSKHREYSSLNYRLTDCGKKEAYLFLSKGELAGGLATAVAELTVS